MSPIESVKVLKSQVHVGGDIKPCLAVVITPMPEDENDIIQIGDDIKAAVMAFNRK